MKSIAVVLFSGLLLAVWILPALAVVPPPAGSSVAVISKAIADVSKKEGRKEWQKAKLGEALGSGDRLRTGQRSIAIIKFKDNSLVRVRQQSELTVTGTMRGASFSKSVNIESGGVGFTVAKQRSDEEFRFTSPTAVASIRGTGGQFIHADEGDTLTILSGLASMFANQTSQSVDVGAGFTGIVGPDGKVYTRPATDAEKRSAEEATRTGDQPMKLEFDLMDGQGKSKSLHVEYKQ